MSDEIKTEIPAEIVGTIGFGLGQVNKPTPKWATWSFRVFFYLASLATIIVTTDNAIPPHIALMVAKYLAFATMGVHGISKMFGVDVTQDAQDAKDAFKLKQ